MGCGSSSSDCNSCPSKSAGCGGAQQPQDMTAPLHELSSVKHVIGVVSGKGGVGKSSVTSLMALTMARKGYKVGILDADITGPSIPKMFGIKERAMGNEEGIFPVMSKLDTKLMSINLLLENDTDPVVWRGPVIASTVTQFWKDVFWGDVDFMFVDMPPGTGDVPLTVFQSLPVDGIIIVTSPQELVSMIVEKAVNMAQMMNIPVLGIIENMSYVTCPDCGKQIKVFGDSHVDQIAETYHLPVLGQIPIDPKLSAASDSGNIELFEGNWLDPLAAKFNEMMK